LFFFIYFFGYVHFIFLVLYVICSASGGPIFLLKLWKI
jgi:hypothetical protein